LTEPFGATNGKNHEDDKHRSPGRVFYRRIGNASFGCGDPSGAAKGRDGAIAACNAEAQKRYGGMYYNFDQTREFAYERCMHDRGFAQ
jgi:hypothetical protein